MKYVCLVRHAKAEKDRTDDFQRSLTKDGEHEADLLGKSLKNDGFQCGLIISSDAARSFETAVIISEQLGIKRRKIRIENSLYQGTGIDTYYKILRDLDNSIDSVLISGHNTTLDAAAADMFPGYDRRMTTAAAVCISFQTEKWADVTSKNGNLSFYKFNRQKKKLMKDEKTYVRNLQKKVLMQIKDIFKKSNELLMLNDAEQDIESFLDYSEKILNNSTIVTITDLNKLRNQHRKQEN